MMSTSLRRPGTADPAEPRHERGDQAGVQPAQRYFCCARERNQERLDLLGIAAHRTGDRLAALPVQLSAEVRQPGQPAVLALLTLNSTGTAIRLRARLPVWTKH